MATPRRTHVDGDCRRLTLDICHVRDEARVIAAGAPGPGTSDIRTLEVAPNVGIPFPPLTAGDRGRLIGIEEVGPLEDREQDRERDQLLLLLLRCERHRILILDIEYVQVWTLETEMQELDVACGHRVEDVPLPLFALVP